MTAAPAATVGTVATTLGTVATTVGTVVAIVVATVAGEDVLVGEVDAREAELRASDVAAALPAAGTSEGRQLRRWLTQLLVTERVIAAEASARGIGRDGPAPREHEVLPDATARLELGSVTSTALASSPQARALFAQITAHIDVAEAEIAAYHARDPYRFTTTRRATTPHRATTAHAQPAARGTTAKPDVAATPEPPTPPDTTADLPTPDGTDGWHVPSNEPPRLAQVRDAIAAELLGAARRRAFAIWLDGRRAELVWLAPGYEHPGDPRQPDNTHKH